MTRFTKHEIWQNIKPVKLIVKSDAKGSGVSDKMHKAALMHARDPMVRCHVY